ncbi:MAG: hypothetical protein DWQ37_02205 [Planctomycetota bacterium]|nr:MAG: hypothetical protein DWQ37_02205 [Planctomycetota bacterium]
MDSGRGLDSELESVCRLFAPDADGELFASLRRRARSPLQVPFYYLDLVRSGQHATTNGCAAKPTAEDVDLAYRAILQRPPESRAIVRHQVETCQDARQLAIALLTSREATLQMPRFVARAFPHARRLWHVHIPKTAGTSFFLAATQNGWGYVNTNMLAGAVGSEESVAAGLRLDPETAGSGIVSGHWKLHQFMDCVGPFDRVVTFVREPLEFLISSYNYAVDVVSGRDNVHSDDPGPFLKRGLDPESFANSFRRGFFVANVQCSYLAPEATSEAALRNLAQCGGDVYPADAADRALAEFFPSAPPKRANVSNKHVRPLDPDSDLREELLAQNHHDYALYEVARRRNRELRAA